MRRLVVAFLLQACFPLCLAGARSSRLLAEADVIQTEKVALQQRLSQRPARAPMGIIIPAGGQIYFQNAAALVGLIRKHHRCQLPIEIFYSGQEEYYAPAVKLIEVHRSPAWLLYHQTARSATHTQ